MLELGEDMEFERRNRRFHRAGSRIDRDELAAAARKRGVERLSDVKWAVLETSGEITVALKSRGGKGAA